MKTLGLLLYLSLGLFVCLAQPTSGPTNETLERNRTTHEILSGFSIGSGKTVTVKSGGSFVADAGSTIDLSLATLSGNVVTTGGVFRSNFTTNTINAQSYLQNTSTGAAVEVRQLFEAGASSNTAYHILFGSGHATNATEFMTSTFGPQTWLTGGGERMRLSDTTLTLQNVLKINQVNSTNANNGLWLSTTTKVYNRSSTSVGISGTTSAMGLVVSGSNVSGGDSFLQTTASGVQDWSHGVRHASTNWVLNNGSDLAGTDVVTISTNGSATFASGVSSVATGAFNVGPLPSSLQGMANVSGVLSIDATGFAPTLFGRRFNGTITVPTTVTSGQSLLEMAGIGYDGTAWVTSSPAAIVLAAAENWTASAHGTYITFNTAANGATGNTEKMRLDGDGLLTAQKLTLTTPAALQLTGVGAGIEIGAPASSGTPLIDFHSSGVSQDYDARIAASGGSTGVGLATLQLVSAATTVTGTLTVQGSGASTFAGNLTVSGTGTSTVAGSIGLTSTSAGYIEGTEQGSSPAAPSANGFRIYAKDNGSGKTVLYVRFASGSEQVLATEP